MKAKNLRFGASRRGQNPILLAAIAALPLVGAAHALADTSIWTFNGDGNWTTAANWSNGDPNSSATDVTIDDGDSSVNVSLTFGLSRTVHNLTIGSNDQISITDNSFLTLAGPSLANSGTISIASAGNASQLIISNDATLSGGGTISLQNITSASQITGNGSRLTNANNVIMGQGNVGANAIAITNQIGGLIDANVSGAGLTLDPASVTDGFRNLGTIQASNGGILTLTGNGNGAFNNTGGIIRALNGSTVQLINNASITGGTLTSAGTGQIQINFGNHAFIDNLTNAGSIAVNDNSFLHTSGTINNTGSILMSSAGNFADLTLEADTTLTGNGTVTLANNNAARIVGAVGGVRLTNATNRIQGRGQVGSNNIAITNQSIIDANVNGTPLTLDPVNTANDGSVSFINSGTLQASSGGILVFTGNGGGAFSNSNLIIAKAGSAVQLVNGASITGGTFSTEGDGEVQVTFGQSGVINNLANSGLIAVKDNAFLHINGTINNLGSITMTSAGNLSDLIIDSDATLSGSGAVLLAGTSNARIVGNAAGLRLTNNSTISGRGQIGVNSMAVTNNSLIDANLSGLTLTLDPENAANTFLNQGTLQASNGGILILSGSGGGTFLNTNGYIQAQTGSEVRFQSSADLTGGTLTTFGSGVIDIETGHQAFLHSLNLTGHVVINDNTFLHTTGTINNTGSISIVSTANATDLVLDADTSLTGAGTVFMSSAANSRIVASASGFRLTTNNTIEGRGQIGLNGFAITSQNLINANISGQTLTLDPVPVADAFLNQGTLQASNGGILVLTGSGGGAFTNTGKVIQALNGSELLLASNADITGGTLTTSGSGVFDIVAGNQAFLHSLNLTGHVVINDNTFLHTTGTINNTGSISIVSTGNATDLVLDADTSLTGAGTVFMSTATNSRINASVSGLRLTSNNTIEGRGQIGLNVFAITNQNLINANISGQTLILDPAPVTDAFLNQGTLQASNGGILVLTGTGGGAFTNTGKVIQALNGSELQLASNADITGGTLSSIGTGVIDVPSGNHAYIHTLALPGHFLLTDNTFLHTTGTITNSGSIDLISGGNATDLLLDADTTFTGGGTITLANSTNARINTTVFGVRLTNTNNIIQGRGQIGLNAFAITNLGTIDANVTGQTLVIDPSPSATDLGSVFNNQGTVQASNGGILVLSGSGGGNFPNATGLIRALNGSEVQLSANAEIVGGTLTAAGTGRFFVPGGQHGYITSLTNASSIVLNDNSFLHTSGTINNLGSILISSGGNPTDLRVETDTSLTGNGTITLADSNNARIVPTNSGLRLTNVGNTIQGRGQIGVNALAITNQGIINANVSGLTLTIDPTTVTDAFLNDVTGILRASGGGFANLTGSGGGAFTNNGIFEALDGSGVTLDGSAVLTNNVSGVLTGGTYRSVATGNTAVVTIQGSAITQIAGGTTIELNGAGSTFQVGGTPLEANLAINNGTLKIFGTRTYFNDGAFANGSVSSSTALLQMGGGTFNAPSLVNQTNSTILGFGTINPRPTNHGTVKSQGGALKFTNGILGGSGTVEATAGSGIDLSGAGTFSSADYLLVDATGTLALGSNNFQVSVDYINGNSGTGNSFNPRANVTGTGQIVATPAVSQAITGDVGNGASGTATMDLGNIRVGNSVSRVYQVNNLGATGPKLRGAIQTNNTAGNGGNITDARLSGSGVTAQNFGPIANNSATSASTVTFSGTTAGALTGQQLAVVNNFDNVPDQTLTLTGAAYNPAVGSLVPTVTNFGNYHVGDLISAQTLTIGNTAPAGAFSEDLRAQNFGVSGDISAGSLPPSISVIAGGTNNSIAVTIPTSTPGAKSGSLSMNFVTTGQVNGVTIPGLGTLAIGAPVSSFTANVFQLATASLQTSLNLGQYHVGSVASGSFALSNTAPPSAFTEKLTGSVATFTPAVTGAFGVATINGGGFASAFSATLDTSTSGSKSGTVGVQLTSLAGGAGLSNTNLGVGTTTVSASVYNLAAPQILNVQPVNFGIVHTGDSITQQGLQIKNNAASGGFSENLNANFGTVGTNLTTNGGTINLLLPQGSNSTNMKVGINTGTHSTINSNVQVLFQSDGNGVNSLGQTTLAPQVVNVTGQVNDYAAPLFSKLSGNGTLTPAGAGTYLLDFGTVGQNSSIMADLRLLNDVVAPADNLAGAFATAGAQYSFSGFGAFSPLAPGATLDDLDVTFITSSIGGPFAGSVVFSPRSQNANFDGPLGNVTINITGTVIPEPTSLLSICVAGLLLRRRRR